MLNVLLMLSTAQPPNPVEEIEWHVQHCEAEGLTHVVTTKALKGLVAGESTVAFFGDAALENAYLGRGTFQRLVEVDSAEGAAILQSSELYSAKGWPGSARALIELSDVSAADGAGLEALRGTIRTSGAPLTRWNLPVGPARTMVYYTTSQ